MPLHTKNSNVVDLSRHVAEATGETMTEAIRKALEERRDRLALELFEASMQEMKKTLRDLHRGRKFEPISKSEWDAVHE